MKGFFFLFVLVIYLFKFFSLASGHFTVLLHHLGGRSVCEVLWVVPSISNSPWMFSADKTVSFLPEKECLSNKGQLCNSSYLTIDTIFIGPINDSVHDVQITLVTGHRQSSLLLFI